MKRRWQCPLCDVSFRRPGVMAKHYCEMHAIVEDVEIHWDLGSLPRREASARRCVCGERLSWAGTFANALAFHLDSRMEAKHHAAFADLIIKHCHDALLGRAGNG